jgi:hypothetical protein
MSADLIGLRARAAFAGPPKRLGLRVGAHERRSIVNGIDRTPVADRDRRLTPPDRIVGIDAGAVTSIGAARRADGPPPARVAPSLVAVAGPRAAPVAVMARAAIARAQRARPRI